MAESHVVEVMCNCDDIERCRMELYVSDVRIAFEVIEGLSKAMEQIEEIVA